MVFGIETDDDQGHAALVRRQVPRESRRPLPLAAGRASVRDAAACGFGSRRAPRHRRPGTFRRPLRAVAFRPRGCAGAPRRGRRRVRPKQRGRPRRDRARTPGRLCAPQARRTRRGALPSGGVRRAGPRPGPRTRPPHDAGRGGLFGGDGGAYALAGGACAWAGSGGAIRPVSFSGADGLCRPPSGPCAPAFMRPPFFSPSSKP